MICVNVTGKAKKEQKLYFEALCDSGDKEHVLHVYHLVLTYFEGQPAVFVEASGRKEKLTLAGEMKERSEQTRRKVKYCWEIFVLVRIYTFRLIWGLHFIQMREGKEHGSIFVIVALLRQILYGTGSNIV